MRRLACTLTLHGSGRYSIALWSIWSIKYTRFRRLWRILLLVSERDRRPFALYSFGCNHLIRLFACLVGLSANSCVFVEVWCECPTFSLDWTNTGKWKNQEDRPIYDWHCNILEIRSIEVIEVEVIFLVKLSRYCIASIESFTYKRFGHRSNWLTSIISAICYKRQCSESEAKSSNFLLVGEVTISLLRMFLTSACNWKTPAVFIIKKLNRDCKHGCVMFAQRPPVSRKLPNAPTQSAENATGD